MLGEAGLPIAVFAFGIGMLVGLPVALECLWSYDGRNPGERGGAFAANADVIRIR
jgi:hypothetical protein